MPTYEYECDACKHAFEEFQSIKAEPLKKCPKCKKSKLRRLIGAGGALIFKGTGFYLTDYRSESYKKGAKAEKGGSASSESSSKSDSSSKSESSSKPDSASKPSKSSTKE